jgi:hypothetical protein
VDEFNVHQCWCDCDGAEDETRKYVQCQYMSVVCAVFSFKTELNVGWKYEHWKDTAKDRDKWWAAVNAVMNPRFP